MFDSMDIGGMEVPMVGSDGVIRTYLANTVSVQGESKVVRVTHEGLKGTFVLPEAVASKISLSWHHYSDHILQVTAYSPHAFEPIMQYVATGAFEIAVPLMNWKSYPLREATTKEANFSTKARNLWLDWHQANEQFSLRLYGVQSGISGCSFSLPVLGCFNAPKLTLNANQRTVIIDPGISDITLAFWTQDDLLDFLLQLLSLLRERRCLACESRIPTVVKVEEEEYSSPKLRTTSTDSDLSDDNHIDVRSERFRLHLLDRACEVYYAANSTSVSGMYSHLLQKIKEILAGGGEDMKVALAQRVHTKALYYHKELKDYVESLIYPMFRDVNVSGDLNFKTDFKDALTEALRRAGVL